MTSTPTGGALSRDVILALIADTVEEARARWLFWGLFGLSTFLIAIFLFVLNIDLVQGAAATVQFGGGRVKDVADIRSFVYAAYSWISVALYVWGTLLAIFASAGLVPVLLEPGRIGLLLSKPVSRTVLLLGRFAGTILIVAVNHIYLIGGIWLILGAKTHIWEGSFLLAIPISVFMFAVLLCIMFLVGVMFESAALSVMITVATMLVSTLLAQRDFFIRVLTSEWSRTLWLALYWLVPKVYDLSAAQKSIITGAAGADWFAPVWTSTLFAASVLGSAIYIFNHRDF